jgi:hypothetical protein
MAKTPLIVVSIAIAGLIVLASCTNVFGVQTVTSSDQKIISNEIDQKELLFQTILDIANKQEIQNIIQNSETNGGLEIFLRAAGAKPLLINLKTRLSALSSSPSIFTKRYLNHAYNIGLILSKTLSTSKIQSLLECFQESNQGLQKEITAVIEKNDKLDKKIEQLSDLPCDCENDNTNGWFFGKILLCLFLYSLAYFVTFYALLFNDFTLLTILFDLGAKYNCGFS